MANRAPGSEGKPAQETLRVNENGRHIVSGAGGFNFDQSDGSRRALQAVRFPEHAFR